VLLSVALLTLSLVAVAADSAAVYLERARKALEARNIQEAKTQIKRAIEDDPRLGEAWLMLAGAEMEDGETAQAIEHYQRALQFAPDSFVGHYDLALAYLHEKRLSDAHHELERAVTLNPRHADATYNLGMILLEEGKSRNAIKYFQQARSVQPDRLDIAFNLIRAELAAGDWSGALEESQKGERSFAPDSAWQAAVGKLFLESGHSHDSIPLLENALRIEPTSSEVRYLLASAYLQSRQPELVLTLMPEANSAEGHFLRGSALLVQHRLTEADSEADRALEGQPKEPRYLLLDARIRQTEGRQDAALELLRQAAEQAPQWGEPYYSMAVSYYFEHRYEEARQVLSESLKREPNSSRSLFLFAATLTNQGSSHEAEEYLRRAIAIQPDNARYWLHLGAARLRNNNFAGAQEALERAIRLKPDYALPHYQLGKLLARSNARAALRELERAIECEPGLVPAYYSLSRVAARLGQKEKSSQALATFNRLKKHEQDEDRALSEDLSGELRP
jgi:tetratricopeptide (TPR) repeat protein